MRHIDKHLKVGKSIQPQNTDNRPPVNGLLAQAVEQNNSNIAQIHTADFQIIKNDRPGIFLMISVDDYLSFGTVFMKWKALCFTKIDPIPCYGKIHRRISAIDPDRNNRRISGTTK